MTDRRQGILLVISGPSGVGKGTVIKRLLAAHPEVRRSVSCTTRGARQGEQDGRDYYFVSPQRFEQMQQQGELLEWAVVHEDLKYGTPRAPVQQALGAGHHIVLEIDYQGAQAVREQLSEQAVLVFITPPSWQSLLQRLEKRHTEAPEEVAKRLDSARREISNMAMYEYIIVNDQLDEAIIALEAVLLAERHMRKRTDWQQLQQQLLQQAEEGQLQ